jgi:SPP1 family phage portal protein
LNRNYFGRREIAVPSFDGSSAAETYAALTSVWGDITANAREHKELWNIYKGRQAILDRQKEIRPDINNKVVENRLWEAIQQHLGYTFSKPAQYTNASVEASDVDVLNRYARLDKKQGKDFAVAELMLVGGTAYRICLPNSLFEGKRDEIPYYTAYASGEKAFVLYGDDIKGEAVLCGQFYRKKALPGVVSDIGELVVEVYTREKYYEFDFGKMPAGIQTAHPAAPGNIAVNEGPNTTGKLPIVEYKLNPARLGYVDLGLSLSDAINSVSSNRMDGVEQFIQSILWTNNVKFLTKDEFAELVSAEGGLFQTNDADPNFKATVKFIEQQLDQANTQTLKDDLLDSFYSVVGVPNRNSKASGGDSGSAVELRNGWGNLEARAKNTETWFIHAEMQYLELMLAYCRMFPESDGELGGLSLADIAVSIPRNPNDNLLVKSESIGLLIEAGINPEDATESSGLFADAAAVVKKSEEWQKSIGRTWGKTTTEVIKNAASGEQETVTEQVS